MVTTVLSLQASSNFVGLRLVHHTNSNQYAVVLERRLVYICEIVPKQINVGQKIIQHVLSDTSECLLSANPIENGIEILIASKKQFSWCQLFFVASEQVKQKFIPLVVTSKQALWMKNKYVMVSHGCVTCLDMQTLLPSTTKLPVIDTAWQVAAYDTQHVLVYSTSFAAYLFHVQTEQLKPYPLYYSMHCNMAMANVGKKMMVAFGNGNIIILNKLTRATIELPLPIPIVDQVIALNKVESRDFEFLVCSNTQVYLVQVPERHLQEDVASLVKRDTTITTATSKLIAHKAVIAARIPQALQDENLLNWSFASDVVGKKVIYYLYTGELLASTSSSDLDQIAQVAKHLNDPLLLNFCNSLKGDDGSDDSIMNEQLNAIAVDRKAIISNFKSKIPGFSKFYLAYYYHLSGTNEASIDNWLNQAFDAAPNCLQYHRFQRELAKQRSKSALLQEDDGAAKLVNNQFASDAILKLKDGTVFGHMYYLAKSPFFKSLLELNEEDIITIDLQPLLPDLDESTLITILNFAYANVLSLPDTIAQLQLVHNASHFFGFADLEEACEKQMILIMQSKEAQTLLDYAMLHNCTRLNIKCQEKIASMAKQETNKDYELAEYDPTESKSSFTVAMLNKFFMTGDASIMDDSAGVPHITLAKPECGSIGAVYFNHELRLNISNRFRIQMTLDIQDFTPSNVPQITIGFCAKPNSTINDDNNTMFGFTLFGDTKQRTLLFNKLSAAFKPSSKLEIDLVFHRANHAVKDAPDNRLLVYSSVNNESQELCYVRYDDKVPWLFGVVATNITSSNRIVVSQFQLQCCASKKVVDEISTIEFKCPNHNCGKQYTLSNSTKAVCTTHPSTAYTIAYSHYSDIGDTAVYQWSCCQKEANSNNLGCIQVRHGVMYK